MLSKEQEKELTNFLSIGISTPARYRSRQLQRALQKKKEIKIMRQRIVKIMRPLLRDRKLIGKIALLLEKSGLSLQQQRILLKRIRKLLIDFGRDLHNELDLRGINLQLLPLSVRRFIIALQVLKAEIVHLFRLRLEKDFQLRQMANATRLSIDDRRLPEPEKLDFRELHSMAVSKTLGSYAGMRDMQQGKEYDCDGTRPHNSHVDFSKDDRNKAQEKDNGYQEYKDTRKANSENAQTTKDDYYKKRDKEKKQ